MASSTVRLNLIGLGVTGTSRILRYTAFCTSSTAGFWFGLLVLLGGCVAAHRVPLGEVVVMRDQASQLGSVVSLYPLVDSALAAQLARIKTLERDGRPQEALQIAEIVLEDFPGDPVIWQYIAELSLQTGSFSRSLVAAGQSRALGPTRGALCARSWQSMALAHQALGDEFQAHSAASKVTGCVLKREQRY